MTRELLTSIALAVIVLVAVGRWPAAPRATARLVVGFTHLIEPDILTSAADSVRGGAVAAPLSAGSDPRLADAVLTALVAGGIVATDVAEPLRLALDRRDAPRNAAVMFLADLANGQQPLDVPGPGRANNRFHDRYRVWVPVVRDDRLDDDTVRRMLTQMLPNGELMPRIASAPADG